MLLRRLRGLLARLLLLGVLKTTRCDTVLLLKKPR
jgi:hypothetical protein